MKSVIILFILTSTSHMGNGKPTGVWLEEFTTPYYALRDAGYEVEISSPKGGEIPIDPRSLEAEGASQPESVQRYLKDAGAQHLLRNSAKVNNVDTTRYAAVFLPGGHGTMWDFPQDKKIASIVSQTLIAGRVVAAVCHGPAGLLTAVDGRGKPIVKGRRIAAFTNSEEAAVGLTDEVPFLLEDKLAAMGAILVKEENFQPIAVSDEGLITGQNPASSALVAQLMLEALKKQKMMPPIAGQGIMPSRKPSPTLPSWVPVYDEPRLR